MTKPLSCDIHRIPLYFVLDLRYEPADSVCGGGYTMKYTRFEDLPVWQAASELALRVYALGEKAPVRRHRSMRDQIERAALSVSNNIAEGFERGTTPELLTFLIARG